MRFGWSQARSPSIPSPVFAETWWTGTEPYLGADMFWDHADTHAYLRWFQESRLMPVWHRFVPEGNTGHGLILATAS